MPAEELPLERVSEPARLAPRPAGAHKGTFGTVLVIAGSQGMAGAAALVGMAALRSGAGLVRVASPSGVQPTVAGFEPGYTTIALPQDAEGRVDFDAARPVLESACAAATVVACGPGLGQSPALERLVDWLLTDVDRPLVLDADALNNLGGGRPEAVAARLAAVAGRHQGVVLTPHPGEFGRLVGQSTVTVQSQREPQATALARLGAGQLTVLLKGDRTIVTDGRRGYINGTGNPGMATGGSGDCLTGVIAALLAQGLGAFDAAALGACVHGLAGDRARAERGTVGLIARDLITALPGAFVQLGMI